jgi:D-arginine dehydrogenase
MDPFDFVVIGAGIAGASVAYELADHGSVLLLEREEIAGYHTTGRSAAVFTEAYESDEVRTLVRASRPFLSDPPDGFTDTPLLSPMPVMYVARTDQMTSLEAEFEHSDGLVSHLDGKAARDLCPVLRPGHAAAALLEKGACGIDVHALHQAFLRGLRRRGGRVVTEAGVSALARTSVWTVESTAGSFRGSVVVNAAGAWADQLAAMAGVEPRGLTPMRRTAFTFDPHVDTEEWPMVIDIDEDFYFKPDGSLLLASPCDETPMPPCDVRHEELDVAIAIDRIQKATTLEIRHVSSAWAGLRTFAPDRRPVVGWAPGTGGFFWLAGQGGFGIMTSPAMAATATALIVGGELPDGIDPVRLSPNRF